MFATGWLCLFCSRLSGELRGVLGGGMWDVNVLWACAHAAAFLKRWQANANCKTNGVIGTFV